jgi:hypothetical protein
MTRTPLPELLANVARELRARARHIRKSQDFHALVLSAECETWARDLDAAANAATEDR